MAKYKRRANGCGTVVKLSGKRRKPWAALTAAKMNYETEKIEREVIGTFETRQEADKALLLYDPKETERRKLLFKTIYEKWWEGHVKKVEENTIKTYHSIYNKYLSKLDNVSFKELNALFLQDFIDKVDSASSQKLVKAVLAGIFKYAMKHEIVDKDFSKLLDMKKQVAVLERKNFTKEEMAILFEYSERKIAKAILILNYTGLRISEFLDLQKEVINNGYMKIIKSKTEAGRNRIVPIHSKIQGLVDELLEENRKYLYTQDEDKKVTYARFRKEFENFMEEVKMDHTIHDTRHTFSNMADDTKMNKKILAQLVGHKNVKTTINTYVHKDLEALRKAIDLIN